MKRYLFLLTSMAASFLLLFGIAEAMHVPLLTNPMPWLRSAGVVAGVIGVGLLVADVVLPVPSSVIMIAHGALFGLWIGALLSLVGSVGASLTGFAIGRAGRDAVRRFVSDAEYDRAAAILDKWGIFALIATRPVPILAETVAILAGASPTGWLQMTIASVVGILPAALAYAAAGAMSRRPVDAIWVFLAVMALAFVTWSIGRSGGAGTAESTTSR
ncbi:MAG TPA: VTT domain-containing protein [Thermoanaerobaculia bacterium]|nr:VTT domain-containing protein [Thermoanaerobaculia bacterium]